MGIDNVIPFPRGAMQGGDPTAAAAAELRATYARLVAGGADPAVLARQLLGGLLSAAPARLAEAASVTALRSGFVRDEEPWLGDGGELEELGWYGGHSVVSDVVPELLTRRATVVTYRVRVDLDGAKPPIWRRLDVPSDLTLDRFHRVLQAALGWWDLHLHAFRMGPGVRDYRREPFGTAHDPAVARRGGPHEAAVRLDEVLGEPGDRLYYEYDFGDSWEHTIRLEEVLPPGPAGCLAGRRACPPEDSGGLSTYLEMLDALGGAGTPRGFGGPFASLDELREWLPEGFEPGEFDRAAVDRAVREELTR